MMHNVHTLRVAAPQRPILQHNHLRDIGDLPKREYLYGRHYIRGSLSATIANGGIGKSTLAIAEGMAMVTGRNLLGVPVPEDSIGAVVNEWSRIAARADCNVELIHHVRKPPYGGQVDNSTADARGASALVNAARSVRILNRMTETEAAKVGINDRWRYIRADDGKANYAPAGAATWYLVLWGSREIIS
jgi:RecA-family ATPase